MTEHNTSQAKLSGIVSHLVELRQRLLWMTGSVLLVFLVLVSFAQEIYTQLAHPMLSALPSGVSMIATDVTAPFLVPIKVTFLVSVFMCIPFLLYQLWAFIAPGLHQHEKKLGLPIIASSAILFYLGTAFAYFVVLPIALKFFVAFAPEGVAVMTDVGKYVDFVLTMFFAFGVAFEVPIAIIILVVIGAVSTQQLSQWRPYVVVGAFVVGMLLTPPDIISQTLLAIPMLILYELGIFMAKLYKK